MSTEVKVPAVGESITSGVLSGWLKQNGDTVKDGEPIYSLETDKISTEVPAPASGTLQIMVAAGEEVKIGQIVAMIDVASGASKPEPKEAAPTASRRHCILGEECIWTKLAHSAHELRVATELAPR